MRNDPLTMKAWTCRSYGDPGVLRLEDVARPRPGKRQISIRIHATTVSSGDARVRALRLPPGFGAMGRLMLGFTGPRQPILGTELAGTVEAVGSHVTRWKPGDAVIAFPGGAAGCHAQYRLMDEDGRIAQKPPRLSFEEASSLMFGATTALDFLRRADLRQDESILVIGASGAVGSAIVQFAHRRGARVTAVTSARNLDLALSLGAQSVIDYGKEDFRHSTQRWDVIADAVGASTFGQSVPVLTENGRYLAVAGGLGSLLVRRKGRKRQIAGPAAERREDIEEISRLAEAGILVPLIDTVYGFSQLPQAHAHVDSARKRGSVVVTVAGSD